MLVAYQIFAAGSFLFISVPVRQDQGDYVKIQYFVSFSDLSLSNRRQ